MECRYAWLSHVRRRRLAPDLMALGVSVALALPGCTRLNPGFVETDGGTFETTDSTSTDPTTQTTTDTATATATDTDGRQCRMAQGAGIAQQPERLVNSIIDLDSECGATPFEFYAQLQGSTFIYCDTSDCTNCIPNINLSFTGVNLNTNSTCFRGYYAGYRVGSVCNTTDVILWEADSGDPSPVVIYSYEDPIPLPQVNDGISDQLTVSRSQETFDCTCASELPLNCCDDTAAQCNTLRFETTDDCVDAENGAPAATLAFADNSYDILLIRSFTTPTAAGNECAPEPYPFSMWAMLRK